MNTQIVSFAPTYFYMSVDYTDGLKAEAARESYKGVVIRVEYNGGERTAPGPRPEQKVRFFTGDFSQDYADAVGFAQMLADGRDVPFMGSSSVDDYFFDAGYVEDVYAGAEEIPFASDADIAADQANDSAWPAAVEAEPADLPFLAPEMIIPVVAADNALEAAWDTIPAAKLRWALANVIAASRYNTDFPGAPLGRDNAIRSLDALDRLIQGQGWTAE